MIKIKKQPLSLEQQYQGYYGVKEHKGFGNKVVYGWGWKLLKKAYQELLKNELTDDEVYNAVKDFTNKCDVRAFNEFQIGELLKSGDFMFILYDLGKGIQPKVRESNYFALECELQTIFKSWDL